MQLELFRFYEVFDKHKNRITIGELTSKEQKWTIIEPKGPATKESGLNQRIPTGLYKLEWTKTSVTLPKEYNNNGLLLTTAEDKQFRHRLIIIHIGNYARDTQGCLLPNENYNANLKRGIDSTKATKRLYDFVKSYMDKGESVFINITEPEKSILKDNNDEDENEE